MFPIIIYNLFEFINLELGIQLDFCADWFNMISVQILRRIIKECRKGCHRFHYTDFSAHLWKKEMKILSYFEMDTQYAIWHGPFSQLLDDNILSASGDGLKKHEAEANGI